MTNQDDTRTTLLNPDKIRWLKEEGSQTLTQNQQALLLALAQLESELGREPSEEEAQALEALADQLEGFDPQEIASAIQRVVRQPTDPDRKTTWPKLKKRLE